MSFTIQSASVPVVEANSFATTSPAIVTSLGRAARVSQLSTSGRSSTKRWSSTSHVDHFEPPAK